MRALVADDEELAAVVEKGGRSSTSILWSSKDAERYLPLPELLNELTDREDEGREPTGLGIRYGCPTASAGWCAVWTRELDFVRETWNTERKLCGDPRGGEDRDVER